ncbi:MAG: GTP-binding protein [Planctomycetota bacterium]
METQPATECLPATLLAGFLGSGKTTLLNRVLHERADEPIAVLVNEFGEVGIDGRLVVRTAEEVVQLENGCLCCEVRGDLADAMDRLLRGRGRLGGGKVRRILIEASGLASPGPIVQTLVLDARLAGRIALDGVVTVAHALHVADQLERHPEAAEQVAYADLLLLNHVDAVDAAALDRAEAALRTRNAAAPIERTERAACDIARMLSLGASSAEQAGGWRLHDLDTLAVAGHTHGVGTVVLRSDELLDLHRLKMWIQFLAARRTHELYRVKGLIACRDHPRSVLVQGMYQWLELGPGPEDLPAESALVLIGRNLDQEEIERGWQAVRA